MAIQLINTGTGANKGDGDSLRSAFTKINNNFTELTYYLGSTVTDFTEIVEDVVGSMLIHGDHTVGGIKVDYNDTSSKIIINLITPAALVPPSGSTGTVLTKNSIADFDTTWTSLTSVVGPTGPTGPSGSGIVYLGAWNSATIYAENDVVNYQNGSYISTSINYNSIPTNLADWDILALPGPTGPAGPQGPGADQDLNTTSSVVFQSINVTTGMSVTKTLSIGGMPIDGDGHLHLLNTLTQSPLMVASNYVGGARPEILIRGYGGNRPEGLVNTSGLSGLILESSRGTESSPSAIQANDVLGYVGFGGFDTNRWSTEATLNPGFLASYATETWNGTTNTTTNAGTGFILRTQPNGVQLNPASRQIWLQTSWQNGTATEPPQQIVRIGNASQSTPTLLTSNGQHFFAGFGAANIEYINVKSKIIGVPEEDHSVFEGDINGITLNVTTVTSGFISVGQHITGTNILTSTFILSTGTGVGGTGTYFVSKSQTVSSTNIRGGSDNNTLQSTNVLTFITGRKSGANGRRSALKKDDTIFNIAGKAQFLEFTLGEGATVADLRFKALENYTTSTRGSAFIIGTVNSGTTATSTRLDLSDQEHKYRSDRHYFTATNATLTNVVVEGHVLPAANSAFDLGTSSTQWRSLYVGTSTIYLGGTALSVSGGNLTIDGAPVSGGGGNTGNFRFNNSILYTNAGESIYIDPSNDEGNTGYIFVPGPNDAESNALAIVNQQNGGLRLGSANANWDFAGDGTLSLPEGVTTKIQADDLTVQTNDGDLTLESDSDVFVKSSGGTHIWEFGVNGNLILPLGAQISPIASGSVEIIAANTANSYASLTSANNGNYMWVDDLGAYVGVNWANSPKTWSWNTAGNLTASGNIIPNENLAYDLGSTSSQWRSLYVGTSTIYLGGTALSISGGNLTIDGSPVSGSGLPSITIPASTGTTYKGLQVSYGLIHSNSQVNELNVSKIVIHKPAITSIEMDTTTEQDDFKVSGLGSSDVLAMFVLYGNTNGPKALSTLTTFAEVIIDNVILDGGEEGSFNTVDEMKSAFYSNYSTISAAAGGLDSDFEFYNPSTTVNTGTTTVQEGSGAAFSIVSPGDGFAYVDPPTVWLGSEGTNYLVGHKIKILGTDLGGITPDNDAIITITGVGAGGSITTATITGTGGDVGGGTYNAVTGTNYQVGSGFEVSQIFFTNTGTYDYLNLHSAGTNYVVGDILTLLGSGIVNGSSPTNDITITITAVDGGGVATTWTVSGVLPRQWRTNNISDGGNDQYDGANYINSSFASQINYNQGNTVADGIAEFGTGSSYTFVYNTGTFGLLVTGNASTYIETSGNSGADGDSTTESGNLYGPSTAAETFDNAVTHLNIVGDPYAGPIVSFTRPDNSDETIDILIPDDGEGAGVAIARDSNGNGIFNPYREGSWDSDVSPGGTLWNIDGWADLSDVESRTYSPLYEAFGFGGLGNKIVGTECVMYLPDNGKYYAVKFDSWTQGGNGGGFAYTRRELDLTSLSEGIRFSDGTRLKSAEGVGRVKLRSPGSRRIEEVYGYKAVSLSQVVTSNITTPASRSGSSTNTIWIDSTATTIDDIISNPANYNNAYDFEFSLDNNIWYEWTNSTSFSGNERGYSIATTVTYLQDDTIYFRYKTGGEPVVWWDKADLPGGSSNFRGAVIDYHAWTGESTIIGTIHIVDDDGEEHISHQEVQSGSTDGENDDLWYVTSEGQIKYRRIDGEGKILKVQWSAKVFYGSEYYDD